MAREKNDSSANNGGMRNAKMPSSHFEHNEGQLNPVCGEKYSSEFGAPQDYDKSTKGLADYVRKNKMKY